MTTFKLSFSLIQRLVALFHIKSIIQTLIYTHLQVNLATLSMEILTVLLDPTRRFLCTYISDADRERARGQRKGHREGPWMVSSFFSLVLFGVLSRSRWLE